METLVTTDAYRRIHQVKRKDQFVSMVSLITILQLMTVFSIHISWLFFSFCPFALPLTQMKEFFLVNVHHFHFRAIEIQYYALILDALTIMLIDDSSLFNRFFFYHHTYLLCTVVFESVSLFTLHTAVHSRCFINVFEKRLYIIHGM